MKVRDLDIQRATRGAGHRLRWSGYSRVDHHLRGVVCCRCDALFLADLSEVNAFTLDGRRIRNRSKCKPVAQELSQ